MKTAQKPTAARSAIIIVLIIVTVIAYSGIVHNGFINYDDPGYIVNNSAVQQGLSLELIAWSFTATIEANWHPLTWISHAIDYSLFGLNPAYHHASNLVYHLFSVIVLFLSLEYMTKAKWQSAFVALLFAIHPLHVESVAWAAERKDVLSGLFWMLTLAAYAKYRMSPSRAWYAVTLLAFALGLLSKPMLVTLPFVLVLLDYWPLEQLTLSEKNLKKMKTSFAARLGQNLLAKAPFFALSFISSVVTYIVQERSGTVAESTVLPVFQRVTNSIVSYAEYIRKTFIPTDLSIFYPHPGDGFAVWKVVLSFIVLIVITAIVWKYRSSKPYLVTGWLWFLGTLVPVIGLVQVGLQSMADRYSYLSSIGISIMLAWGIPPLLKKAQIHRQLMAAAVVIVSLFMVWETRAYVSKWKSTTTLFEHALTVTTDNHIAHNNLGVELADSGKHAEALLHLREAVRLKPNEVSVHSNLAKSLGALGLRREALQHYNWISSRVQPDPRLHTRIGDLLADEGRTEEAIQHFRSAIRLDSTNNVLFCKLAELYAEQGAFAEATKLCNRVISQTAGYADAHRILGVIAGRQEHYDEALTKLSEAIRLDSANGDTYSDFGILYERLGKPAEAVEMYNKAIRFNPLLWNAHLNLGILYARQSNFAGAESHWQKAIEVYPASMEARMNLARLYVMQGKNRQAVIQFQEALRIDPANVLCHYQYGSLLMQEGKIAEAGSHFREAIRLDPSFQPAQLALQKLQGQ